MISILAAGLAAVVTFAAPDSPRQTSDIETFRHWLDLARTHVPGELDAPVEEVRSYSLDELSLLEEDLKGFKEFLNDSTRTRLRGRTRFSPVEQFQAARIAADEKAAGTANRLLKRLAILHTDALWLPGGNPYLMGADLTGQPDVTLTQDGMAIGRARLAPHLPIARLALSAIAPSPAADSWTQLWYQASTSYLFFASHLAAMPAHLQDRKASLPDDAGSIYAEACLNEVFASDRIQQAVESQRMQGGRTDTPGLRNALSRARGLFSQLKPGDLDYAEARVRLAHVIWRLGETRAAADELESWLAVRGRDRGVQYYAYLFLGAARWTLHDREAASRAYEDAHRLYPAAQSPVIGLLLVKPTASDVDASAMSVLSRPAADRDDPWLDYELGPGRHVMALMSSVWRSPDLR